MSKKHQKNRRNIALSLGAISLFMFTGNAFAQFEDLLNNGQQEVIGEAITNSLSGLSEAELEQLSSSALTATGAPGQEQQAAPRSEQFNPSALLSEHTETQRLLEKYSEDDSQFSRRANDTPLSLGALQNLSKENFLENEDSGIPFDIRKDAIRESAISYGARGGLAWRTYAISQEMETRSRSLDRVFDFSQLLIPAPSGLLIEPPIISESIDAMLIESDGQQAAISDRIYNILNNARIVSAPRTWRTYLERTWPAVEPPPDILRPETDEERALWVDLVTKGWKEGVQQADDIFQEDLNTLVADFRGMVRYRLLLAQGMISQPYALQVDRGVTGGGGEMRVGDRAVQITGVPQLITGSDQWTPASR